MSSAKFVEPCLASYPAKFIEPSLADAPVIRPVMRKGRLAYVVHGICVVGTLDEALDLITDRRQAPRSVPVADVVYRHEIEYGLGNEPTSYKLTATYL